jgi:hypothetical protein
MKAPKKAKGVPEDAVWDASEGDGEWIVGPMVKGKRHGAFTYYYRDGALSGHVGFAKGERHGTAEWFSPKGDLWEVDWYEDGELHGKQVWLRVAKGETRDLWSNLPQKAWRMEMLYVRGEGKSRYFTLYSKAARNEPVAVDKRGRSIALGEQMDKILPGSVLLLVEKSFDGEEAHEVHAGSLAKGSKGARGRYVFVGEVAKGIYQLTFKYDDDEKKPEQFFVPAEEISRAFTLAADYALGTVFK